MNIMFTKYYELEKACHVQKMEEKGHGKPLSALKSSTVFFRVIWSNFHKICEEDANVRLQRRRETFIEHVCVCVCVFHCLRFCLYLF
jgi:hypothetical protein